MRHLYELSTVFRAMCSMSRVTVVVSDTCNSLWSKASFLSDPNGPITTGKPRGRHPGAPFACPHAAPPAAARGRPPVLLELGDDLVGNEPHGVHHHVPRHRCRPVDLEHDLVGAEVFPVKVDALHHLLRRPKQVGV